MSEPKTVEEHTPQKRPPQYVRRTAKAPRRTEIAYLCMEFGVREGLELYSGGLGILAGDVVKTAYDSDLPVFGVGILWDEGYTQQTVDEEGHTVDSYPKIDRTQFVEVTAAEPFSVVIKGVDIPLRAFTVEGLGEKLYLLEPSKEEDRRITRRLYQGSEDDRLAQEIVLGVGGVRLIRALGKHADYLHFNEGHSVFAGLELIKEKMTGDEKLSFEDALKATKSQCLFTTHTPVKAGNETHEITGILSAGIGELGLSAEQLEEIGGSPFGMTEAAFSLCCRNNAVSHLHQRTAVKMWEGLKVKPKIFAITNGVHVPSWQCSKIRVYHDEEVAEIAKIKEVEGLNVSSVMPEALKDDQIWEEHMKAKIELIAEVKKLTGVELSQEKLLVGFARRATTYKRHTLLFHQKAANMRLQWKNEKDSDGSEFKPVEPTKEEKLVEDALREGKLQVIFSGKAHPQDDEGKEQIRFLHQQQKDTPKGLVFLQNYNIKIGKLMTRGCDLWLNTPLRQMEACGTSGMKAAMNGVLNCSILDGWWSEGCVSGETGWKIGLAERETIGADERDSAYLHKVLLQQVMPTYYGDEKHKWRSMMRRSIEQAKRGYSTDRMMKDYNDYMYNPKYGFC